MNKKVQLNQCELYVAVRGSQGLAEMPMLDDICAEMQKPPQIGAVQ
jgi:hypothetical protein